MGGAAIFAKPYYLEATKSAVAHMKHKMTYEELERHVLELPHEDAAQLFERLRQIVKGSSVGERHQPYVIVDGGNAMEATVQRLLERLTKLSPEKLAEAGNFIEFLHQQELAQVTSQDAARASEASFARIWDNDDDAFYDTRSSVTLDYESCRPSSL